jgi:glycosyltransferase involved in cell wall biosynthesis
LRPAHPTILQIIPHLDTGGAELSTLEVTDAIVRAGGRSLVATEGGRLARDLAAAGGKVITFPAATKNPLRIIANARALRGIIVEEGVSLVHARSRAPAWSALLAARRSGIPFVTTYHGAYGERGPFKRLYNSVMARADLVIANSGYTARLIETRYGTDSSRIRVIHRGVDMTHFDPSRIGAARTDRLRREWGIAPGQRVILHAARLTGWKGQRVLIDAVGELDRAGCLGNTVLVLAGDNQGRTGYRAELLARARALGVDDRVRIVGHVADIAAAFAIAYVAVVASIEPEAFGRAATEAQAMTCPVIATNIGAPPETVIGVGPEGLDTATGWLVPPNDAPALAASLAAVLGLDPETRARLGARARSHVAEHFTLAAMKTATLAVYDELLGTSLASRLAAAAQSEPADSRIPSASDLT